MSDMIDWQQPPRRRRRLFFLVLGVVAVVIFSSRTALSYYVDALWFGSLGYGEVFRKTLALQWAVFATFFVLTFPFLYGWFLALRSAYQSDLPDDHMIVVGGRPLKLPVARILRLLGLMVSLLIAFVTGTSVMTGWPTVIVSVNPDGNPAQQAAAGIDEGVVRRDFGKALEEIRYHQGHSLCFRPLGSLDALLR